MNETDHQWELLLISFIYFILFQYILEFSLYILTVSFVFYNTEKKYAPPPPHLPSIKKKKNARFLCIYVTCYTFWSLALPQGMTLGQL